MPHIHEQYDFTVGVFVVYRNTVLLRKHDKFNIWMGVGGHIELDEDPIQAAIREAKEESGLTIKIAGAMSDLSNFNDGYKELLAPRFMYIHPINDVHSHVNSVYFATTEDPTLNPDPNEKKTDMRWFTKAELDDPSYTITDTMRFFAKKALEALSS